MSVTKLIMMVVALQFVNCDDDDNVPARPAKIYNSDVIYYMKPSPPNQDKYKNLKDWLIDGKAEFDKVDVEVRSEGDRRLRAKSIIRKGEWAIFIPMTHMLTLQEVKKNCLVNRKMIQVNHVPLSPLTYFVNHLLQEMRRKTSVWRPYLDVLPTDYKGFPLYFTETDLALLAGSPTLISIISQRNDFKKEYDDLLEKVPEFGRFKYTYDDFLKLRVLMQSRSLTVNLKGEHVQVLVPFADFSNYNINFNLGFDYTPLHDGGFYMQALNDIHKGEELTFNYGRWSNKYFFMNFGFALPQIHMNQYDFDMCIGNANPLTALKGSLVGNRDCFAQRLVNETDHGTWRQVIAQARFLAVERLDEFFQMERKAVTYENYFPAYHQWPINTALEHKMFIYLKNELTKMIKDFASTIEQDQAMLNDPNLEDYRRQILILVLQEKQILQENIQICDLALEVVNKSSEQLNLVLRNMKYQKIQGYIRTELLPMKIELNE